MWHAVRFGMMRPPAEEQEARTANGTLTNAVTMPRTSGIPCTEDSADRRKIEAAMAHLSDKSNRQRCHPRSTRQAAAVPAE
jgi:hypothetical protein